MSKRDSLMPTTTRTTKAILFFIIAITKLSAYLNVKAVAAAASYADTVESTQLIDILSLEDHCEANVCRNFNFDNVQYVAFFDLKAEVRITEDSTYDIGRPTSYDTLIFENSTFAHFPLHFFYSFWVKELDMRNCSIERMTWENFLMAGELRILLLSFNRIERIDELTFNFANEMQYLFLDNNRIDSLVSESFKGLRKLKLLHLQANRLTTLPADMFDYLPELQELNLSENKLRTLSNEIFAKLSNLLTLIVQHNELYEIGEGTFEQLSKLVLLDISHNQALTILVNNLSVKYLVATNCTLNRINIYGQVMHVDLRDNQILELYFSEPNVIESLNLRNNGLQQISSLMCAHELYELDLSNNPELEDLPDPWDVNSLERLDLSNTGLKHLPIAALGDKQKINFLNISANHIKEINPRNFIYLKHLKHFYIHANDWNCYNLKMLMDILIRPNKIYFTPDPLDPEFPGEYINGIACMYRIEDSAEEESSVPVPAQTKPSVAQNANYAMSSESENTDAAAMAEVQSLRNELKVIVQFYDEKFDKLYDMIEDLKARLDQYEQMNSTFWEHITITT